MQRLLLWLFLFFMAGSRCTAQHDDWKITLKDGKEWRNIRLRALEGDTLSFVHSGDLQKTDLATIIEISRRNESSKRVRGLVAGAALGVALGYVVGGIGSSRSNESYVGVAEPTNSRVPYAVLGGVFGGVLGMAIGGSAGTVSYDIQSLNTEDKALRIGSILRAESAETPGVMRDSLSPAGPVTAAPTRPRPSPAAHIGLAIPTGDFADLNGGAAMTGFLIAGDLNIPFSEGAGSLSSLTLCINGVDERALGSLTDTLRKYNLTLNISSWTSIWLSTGVRLNSPLSREVGWYGSGQIGLLFGQSPSIEITGSGASAKVASASATSFAYAIGSGLLIAGRYAVGFRFLHSNPEYTITSGNVTGTGNVSTSILQLTAGFNF
jgi:hypothetical protein